MPKQDTGIELKRDEFSKIFDEYRAKIEEITRRTEKSLHTVEDAPSGNGDNETEHIEVVSGPSQPEAVTDGNILKRVKTAPPVPAEPSRNTETASNGAPVTPAAVTADPPGPPPKAGAVNSSPPVPLEAAPPARPEPHRQPVAIVGQARAERPAFEESAEILYEARHEAKRIVEEAEESARKDARKRTQSQVDKIIEKAKKDAAEIGARANREAEKVRDTVVAESKREADEIIRDITERYRQETEAQASRAMAEAQEKAGKMLADISDSTRQVGQFITEIVTRAKKTIGEMETNLQAEAAELTRIVTETQAKLEAIDTTAREEKAAPAPPRPIAVTEDNPTLAVRLIGETTKGKNGNGILFCGQMEMKSISASFDYQYLKRLKKYLVHIPNIKYLQEYASEKEMSVVFDVLEPQPMLDILNNIPMVDEVITRADDDICLVFKNND